eukprot:scaffold129096_cov23-Tisochrysis_lutea.AAC.2
MNTNPSFSAARAMARLRQASSSSCPLTDLWELLEASSGSKGGLGWVLTLASRLPCLSLLSRSRIDTR